VCVCVCVCVCVSQLFNCVCACVRISGRQIDKEDRRLGLSFIRLV